MAASDPDQLISWLEERLRDERQLLQHRHLQLVDSLRLELGQPASTFVSLTVSSPQDLGAPHVTLPPTTALAILDRTQSGDLTWQRWRRATAHASGTTVCRGGASAQPRQPVSFTAARSQMALQLPQQGLPAEGQAKSQAEQVSGVLLTPRSGHKSLGSLQAALQCSQSAAREEASANAVGEEVVKSETKKSAASLSSIVQSLGRLSDEEMPIFDPNWGETRKALCRILHSKRFDAFLVFVILSNIFIAAFEMDYASSSGDVLEFFTISTRLFLVIYTMELVLRLKVYGRQFLKYKWNCFDTFVVGVSIAGLFGGFAERFELLRILRTLRLVRVFRAMGACRELYLIINGFQSTIKTIGWACAMLGMIVLVLAMFSVDFFQPIVDSIMAEEGDAFVGCMRCSIMFSSVFDSCITWFSILIGGSGLNDMAFKIIERSWWSLLVFGGSISLIGMGFKSLILAVIVENATEAREKDEKYNNSIKKTEEATQKSRFMLMCERIDSDGSGEVTMEELKENISKDAQFRQMLNHCGVEEDALQCVFEIMDFDGSGTVSYEEFVEALFRIKSGDLPTEIAFLRHHLLNFRQDFDRQVTMMRTEIAAFGLGSAAK